MKRGITFFIACLNTAILTTLIHGQSLLKHTNTCTRSTQRVDELERRLASIEQQNIQLERRLQNVDNELHSENSSMKIQELERKLEDMNNEWSMKFQEFERQLAGNIYRKFSTECVILKNLI